MTKTIPWWKRALFVLLLCLMTGVFGLAATEVYLRVVIARTFEATTDAVLVPSPIPGLGYQLAANYDKNSIRTNDLGLRWRPSDDPPAQRTVLLVGDSVAFAGGVPYEKGFGQLFEAGLTQALGEKVAVWNAGVPGYNSQQEAILMEHLAPALKPDLVVVQFCMNDYLDPPALTTGAVLDATKFGGDARFSLLGLLYSSRAIFFFKEKFKDVEKLHPEWFPVWAHYIHYTHKRAGWANVKAAFLKMQRNARANHEGLLIVLFPVEQQLRIEDSSSLDDLVRFGKENGLDILDLYEPFRRRWRDGLYMNYLEQVHVVDKVHLSEQGHLVAAAEMTREVTAHRDRYFGADAR